MAAETQLIFILNWIYQGTVLIDAPHSGQGSRSIRSHCRSIIGCMRIMAIRTFHMRSIQPGRFERIMCPSEAVHIMPVCFGDVGLYIGLRYIAIVTIQAIVFLSRVLHQADVAPGIVWVMAILTGIIRYCFIWGVEPGVRGAAIPGTC